MKAEERKENETNALRVWVEHLKDRMQGRTVYMVGGSLALLVAVIFIFMYWRSSRLAAESAREMAFNAIDSDKGLDDFIGAANNQGTPPATWAKLEKARLALYHDGIEKLGSYDPKEREAAVAKIEEGRKIYQELVNELKPAALQQEAWLSLAKAELVLEATPKADKADEFRGSLDKAIEAYRKAAAINADSEASKKYAAEAERLKTNRKELETFYRRLNELGTPAPALPKS